jgi:hypothetical protein
MVVVGMKEKDSGMFSVRTYQGGDRGQMSLEQLRAELAQKCADREFDVTLKEIDWGGDEEDQSADEMVGY